MKIALDNTFLTLLLNDDARPPEDPNTGEPISFAQERVKGLIRDVGKAHGRVIIPTPTWSEALVAVPSLEAVKSHMSSSRAVVLAAFDARCAFELAMVTRDWNSATRPSEQKSGRQSIKNDRQIAVIAKVNAVDVFYTSDRRQGNFASDLGMQVMGLQDVPVPSDLLQIPMPLL